MPSKPLRPCKYPNCPELVSSGYCATHHKVRNKDKQNTNAWHSWYTTARWRKVRLIYLRCKPLCVKCETDGRLTPATVVDHVIDHKGDVGKFWDTNNWQSLCKQCHDRKTLTTNLKAKQAETQ